MEKKITDGREGYIYSVRGAFDAGENRHPCEAMRELGFKVVMEIPFTIGDCWVFLVEAGNNIKLPDFINRKTDLSVFEYFANTEEENGKE